MHSKIPYQNLNKGYSGHINLCALFFKAHAKCTQKAACEHIKIVHAKKEKMHYVEKPSFYYDKFET